jgi:glycosyltransferase involved in cell wall biosynthesis
MKRLRISVAMCTYNGAGFLSEQLDSIAAQTRLPEELVICDDCSTDETVEVVNAFARRACISVHLKINESTLGATKNFEKAIGLCHGDIIALADQDDVWKPQKLLRIVDALERNPQCLLVFSDGKCVDRDGLELGFTLWDKCQRVNIHRLLWGGEPQLKVLLKRDLVTGATSAMRRNLFENAIPIPDIWLHDAWLAAVAAAENKISGINESLIHYRLHGNQQVGVGHRKLGKLLRSKLERGKQEELKKFQVLRDFLRGKANPGLQAELDSKIRHLEMRSSLSPNVFRRFIQIGEEALSGRYHKFSSGLQSIILDGIRS